MATIITKDAPYSSDLRAAPKRSERTLKVNATEFDGIRNILDNPKPPSAQMKEGWEDYLRYAADNPHSNW